MPLVIPTDKELRLVYRRMIAKIKAMTSEERMRTMIRAGIYTKSGQLTEKYGGPPKKRIKRKAPYE